jgi:hypothetical protein
MIETIRRDDLAGALQRCCDANPSQGPGAQLHPDAALMGELLGMMIHHGEPAGQPGQVRQEIRDAVERWR